MNIIVGIRYRKYKKNARWWSILILDTYSQRIHMWHDTSNYILQYIGKIPSSNIKRKNEDSINSFRDGWRIFGLITDEYLKDISKLRGGEK